MNSPFTGINGTTDFTGETVDGESIGVGDGSKVAFATTLAYTPVRTGVTRVTAGNIVLKVVSSANGIDTLASIDPTDTTSTGTVDLNSGAISITLKTAPAAEAPIKAVYDYNMDLTEVGFSQVDLDLQSVSIEAKPRKIRARWLLDAAFELQKTKGNILAA